MKIGRITATVFGAVAATGITTATVHGQATEQPSVVSVGNASSGVDHGVGYRITVSPVEKTITATVENGRFEAASDGAVVLRSENGSPIAEVPPQYDAAHLSMTSAQHIGAEGQTLTLTPTAGDIDRFREIGSYDRLMEQIYKNQTGIAVGATIGGIIGLLLIPLWLVSIPGGVLLGAIAGGYATGGQEFLDAVQAFATGQQ